MNKIIRQPGFAGGGITDTEREAMAECVRTWTARAFRTDPIEPDKIVPAVKALYAAAQLAEPIVVIVPSPLVMAMAGGFAAAIWHLRAATAAATLDATHAAALGATADSTNAAMDDATRDATYNATFDAVDDATRAAMDAATFVAVDPAVADATFAATHEAVDAAVADATFVATDAAAYAATDAVTFAATAAATRDAVDAATDAAMDDTTRAATDAATAAATRDAVDAATAAATYAATDAATFTATRDATDDATRAATRAATYAATYAATHDATYDATFKATYAATKCVGWRDLAEVLVLGHAEFGLACTQKWWHMYQGGNMWPGWPCYLAAARDVLGLRLPEHAKYAAWEACATHGGFRIMHEKFCMVSDFPEVLLVDDRNRPHCDDGPSHRWRDGWELYHVHGVRVDKRVVMAPASYTGDEIRALTNSEVVRVLAERMGWPLFLERMGAVTIDTWTDPRTGLDYELLDLAERMGERQPRWLRMQSPALNDGTEPSYIEKVHPGLTTAQAARRWQCDPTRPEPGECNKQPDLTFRQEA